MDGVRITIPEPGSQLDYSKPRVRIEWQAEGKHKGQIKEWWLYLGSQEGLFDIVVGPMGNAENLEIAVDRLPTAGHLYGQVSGVYLGKSKDDRQMDEEVISDLVRWSCPNGHVIIHVKH
jgi:hypothetical protein